VARTALDAAANGVISLEALVFVHITSQKFLTQKALSDTHRHRKELTHEPTTGIWTFHTWRAHLSCGVITDCKFLTTDIQFNLLI